MTKWYQFGAETRGGNKEFLHHGEWCLCLKYTLLEVITWAGWLHTSTKAVSKKGSVYNPLWGFLYLATYQGAALHCSVFVSSQFDQCSSTANPTNNQRFVDLQRCSECNQACCQSILSLCFCEWPFYVHFLLDVYLKQFISFWRINN